MYTDTDICTTTCARVHPRLKQGWLTDDQIYYYSYTKWAEVHIKCHLKIMIGEYFLNSSTCLLVVLQELES